MQDEMLTERAEYLLLDFHDLRAIHGKLSLNIQLLKVDGVTRFVRSMCLYKMDQFSTSSIGVRTQGVGVGAFLLHKGVSTQPVSFIGTKINGISL